MDVKTKPIILSHFRLFLTTFLPGRVLAVLVIKSILPV